MKYKKLHNFKEIINRTDFNYISDLDNIRGIGEIITMWLPNSGINDNLCLKLLRDFNSNLESFYYEIGGDSIVLLNTGFHIEQNILNSIITIFSEKSERRTSIGRHSLKRIRRDFLNGLSLIYKGVLKAFEPDSIGKTKISNEQITRFIFNKKEGLGRGYKFNTKGKHSAYNKIIYKLNNEELVVVIKLLLGKSQIRMPNGWIDRGEKGTIVRILGIPERIYFIYKKSEHDEYEKQLNIPPEKVSFAAA